MATSWYLTSLTVLGGALHGKKLAIEDAVVEVLIGSDPDCHLHIDLPTVSPIHARLWVEPDDVTVYGTRSGPGVFVNFERVDGEGKLRPGDMLWLGPPQSAGSVMLKVHFEERDSLPPALVTPLPGEEAAGEAHPVSLHPTSLGLADEPPPIPVSPEAPGGPPLGPSSLADSLGVLSEEEKGRQGLGRGAVMAPVEPPAAPKEADEALGVLPEEAPTPLQSALRAEEDSVPAPAPAAESAPAPAAPEPASAEPPTAPPASPGFEDFLIMDSQPAAPAGAAPPTGQEFIVSGFEAEWPDTGKEAAVAAPPAPKAAAEDVFFIDEGAEPPPVPAASAAEDAFFIEGEGILATPAPPVPPPTPASSSPAPATAPAAAPVFVPEHVADAESLSFAAAFLEEPKVAPPAPAVKAPPPAPAVAARPAAPPPPAAKAVAPPPTTPTPATTSPPPSKPPVPGVSPGVSPIAPGVSQRVPPGSVPPRSPSSTAAVRPLPRPDVSQSVARGDRPPTPRAERTQPARPRRPPAPPIGRYAAIGAVALLVLGGIGFLVTSLMKSVRLDSIEPQRARIGDTIALTGSGFAASPGGNVVLFGDREASVATASASRLEVVVPDLVTPAGAEAPTAVRVRVGRAESKVVEISVFAGPVLHGISPDVAMPGEEVVLAGSGWGLGPGVRFGGLPGEVLEVRETSIRVRVPAIDGGVGTAAPVVVTSGSLESNAGPFYVGRIPLLIKAEPTSVTPGDVVTLTGRGFRRERTQNSVQVGGVRALVVSAFDSEIKVVVPWVPAGSRTLEVRVPSSVAPAQVPLVVNGPGESVDFRFVAEPFDAVPGRDHAVLATGLGPAFVLASSGGRSSAERALEASRRLNEAGIALRASRDLSFELRDPDSRPALALSGRPELVLEVTNEDAAAYGEDWTGLRGRGGAVTAGRLGRWWEAVARDLVLLLVRGERPHFAADLAPEGRVFVDLVQSAPRGAGPGIATTTIAQARPPLRAALRLVALRVPPTVRGPVGAAPVALPSVPAATPTSASAARPMPTLEGAWTGSETEGGRQRYVTVTFRGSTGTIAYEGVMTVSAPLLSVEQPQKGAVRFTVEVRGGLRYYSGRWDGQALAGKIATDPGGAQGLGTFELRPR